MAVYTLTTGATTRAPILETVLTQIGACGAFPATPLHLSSTTRAWLGDMVETLLAILDHADGDADLEDGDLDRCTAGEDGPKVDAAFNLLWRDAA